MTALTFCACLVQYLSKPSGIDTLSERPVPSIWALPRWQAETYLRASSGREAGEKLAIRYVEEYVPKRASLGVAVWGNDFRFPYLGPTLERTVRMLRTKERIPPDVEWVVASPEMSPLGCAESWDRVAVHPSGWRVYRRLVADTCATPVRLRVTGQRGPS